MHPTVRRTKVGQYISEGARLLWKKLEERGLTQGQAERLIGTHPGLLNRWLYGERRPGLKLALDIERIFGVPAITWTVDLLEPFELPPHDAKTGTDDGR